MTILYAIIAHGTTVLTRQARCAGNFDEVTGEILRKIPENDGKMTYSHSNYLFHYVKENGIIYYAITEDDFERSKAFQFLGDVKRKFQANYGIHASTALPYAMDSEFSQVLWTYMQKYSQPQSDQATDGKVEQIREELDDLKGIMVKNIGSICDRGEKLNLLVDKTEELSQTSVSFKKNSTNLAWKIRCKNMKMGIILVLVLILVIYFIVSAACGGLNWPRCVKHNNGTGNP